jgi:hypothetical protein
MTSSLAPTRSHASLRRERNGFFTSDLWLREAVDFAALAFGRATRAALAHRNPRLSLRRRRAVVDEALRSHRRPDTLLDEGRYLEDALALHECLDAVADLHLRRRLRCGTVHLDMAAPAAGRRRRAALVDPDGPEPNVHPSRVDVLLQVRFPPVLFCLSRR